MTARGHLGLALLPAIPLSTLLHSQEEQFVFLYAVGFGTLLPDIDEPNSFIGRKFGFLSIPLKIFGIKHRTFTHYLIFPLLVFLISLFLDGYLKTAGIGLAFGILIHDIGDMLTKGGIKGFLFPFYRNKTFRILPHRLAFYTASLQEYIIVIFIYIIDLLLIYKLLNINFIV